MRMAGAVLLLVVLTVACGGAADGGSLRPGDSRDSPQLSRIITSSYFAGPGVSLRLARPEFDGPTVTIDGTIRSRDFNIARIVWDWGDGTVEDSWFPARHTYAEPARYMFSAVVYDDHGIRIAAQSSPIDLAD